MAVFYNAGETKKRPGVYQRHSNVGFDSLSADRTASVLSP